MANESLISNPYIGPIAFENKHSHLFFGRPREIQELSSLIIAHSAVLLYAKSGAGKTSLINAGLIPEMEKDRFENFPPARIRATEQRVFEESNVKNIFVFHTLMSWSTLADLPKQFTQMSLAAFLKTRTHSLDQRGRPKPRLLIFDQFEELFTFYPAQWNQREGFFQDLAQCLADDPLLRVLFVIREDYLANLDPYRRLLPEQLNTQYRLECLSQEMACLAVTMPLKKAEGSFAEGVASILVNKLASIRVKGDKGKVIDARGEFVEPVLLQVVCQNLWNKLPSKTKEITFDDLEKFADVTLALQEFYEGALKATQQKSGVWEDKLRELFEYKLITPFATRGTVLRGDNSSEEISNTAIDELESQHIIRSETRGGTSWFELTHDRLIEPIRKSNEVWKRKFEWKRKRKRISRFVFPAAMLLAFLFYLLLNEVDSTRRDLKIKELSLEKETSELERARENSTYNFKEKERLRDSLRIIELQSRTDSANLRLKEANAEKNAIEYWIKYGQLEEARNTNQLSMDLARGSVTRYFVRKEGINGNLDTLNLILQKFSDFANEGYLVDERLNMQFANVDISTPWPLTIVFPDNSEINKVEFQLQWYNFAQIVSENWGIPIPMRVQFRENYLLHEDSMLVIIRSGVQDSLTMKIGIVLRPCCVIIDQKEVRDEGFYNIHRAEWDTVMEAENLKLGNWLWVPKWTQPIWRDLGIPTYPKETLLVLKILINMLDNPDILLTQECVEVMLERIRRTHPKILDEALQVRGRTEQIRMDLIACEKRNKMGLNDLKYFLDYLANCNTLMDSGQVADYIDSDSLYSIPKRLLPRSDSPRPNENIEPQGKSRIDYLFAFKEAIPFMQSKKMQVRCFVSWEIYDTLGSDTFQQELRQIKKSLESRFGVEVPIPPVGRDYLWGGTESEDSCSFRIELLDQGELNSDAKIMNVYRQVSIQKLINELERRLILYRQWWITPEFTYQVMNQQNENIKKWINQIYTLTDIKNILRNVVAPREAEIDAYIEGWSVEEIYSIIPKVQTIDRLSWLLGSLIFWTAAYDPFDCNQIAKCLMNTQLARLEPSGEQIPGDDAAQLVIEGIEYLKKDNIDSAIISFKTAISENRELAEQVFLSVYGSAEFAGD
jgi:hypothetical protein